MFNYGKVYVTSYLKPEEAVIYEKSVRIKGFILQSLAKGSDQIDWKQLQEAGALSRRDEELFAEELKQSIP